MSLLCSRSDSPPSEKSITIRRLDLPMELVALSSPRTTFSPAPNFMMPRRNFCERSSINIRHHRASEIHVYPTKDVQRIQRQQELIRTIESMGQISIQLTNTHARSESFENDI